MTILSEHLPLLLSVFSVLIGGFFLLWVFIYWLRVNNRLKSFNAGDLRGRRTTQGDSDIFDSGFSSPLSLNAQKMKEKIDQAGFGKHYNNYSNAKMVLLVTFLILSYIYHVKFSTSMANLAISSSLIMIFVILVPDMIINMIINKRRYYISSQLPYLLDLMAVCVQTGMTIEASISYLSQEMESFNKPLANLLKRLKERTQVVGLSLALDEAYKDFPVSEMQSFVMTLKQSIKYGSSIYSMLITLASDIREVHMLNLEEKVGKLSAKISIPLIIFIMIPIVILITAPGIMRMMKNF